MICLASSRLGQEKHKIGSCVKYLGSDELFTFNSHPSMDLPPVSFDVS